MNNTNYEVIYGVSLLDDVHNYFPALLYDHGRFNSLPTVFSYVRNQMNTRFNLYSYGASRVRQPPVPTPQVPRTRMAEPPDLSSIRTLLSLFREEPVLVPSVSFNAGSLGAFEGMQLFNTPVIVSPSQTVINENTEIMNGISLPENSRCSICQDSIIPADVCRKLIPCGHTYHKNCIDQWFNRSVVCPTCRHDIREPTLPR